MAASAIVASAPLDAIRDSSSLSDGVGECSVSSPPVAASSTLPPPDKLEGRITRLEGGLVIEPYVNEEQLHEIARLIKADLSEPYSLYTYRYFIHNWPSLTFLVSMIELTWHPLFTSNTYFFNYIDLHSSIQQFNLPMHSVWTRAAEWTARRGKWWAPSCANWSRIAVECAAGTSRCSPLGRTIAGAASLRRSSGAQCNR